MQSENENTPSEKNGGKSGNADAAPGKSKPHRKVLLHIKQQRGTIRKLEEQLEAAKRDTKLRTMADFVKSSEDSAAAPHKPTENEQQQLQPLERRLATCAIQLLIGTLSRLETSVQKQGRTPADLVGAFAVWKERILPNGPEHALKLCRAQLDASQAKGTRLRALLARSQAASTRLREDADAMAKAHTLRVEALQREVTALTVSLRSMESQMRTASVTNDLFNDYEMELQRAMDRAENKMQTVQPAETKVMQQNEHEDLMTPEEAGRQEVGGSTKHDDTKQLALTSSGGEETSACHLLAECRSLKNQVSAMTSQRDATLAQQHAMTSRLQALLQDAQAENEFLLQNQSGMREQVRAFYETKTGDEIKRLRHRLSLIEAKAPDAKADRSSGGYQPDWTETSSFTSDRLDSPTASTLPPFFDEDMTSLTSGGEVSDIIATSDHMYSFGMGGGMTSFLAARHKLTPSMTSEKMALEERFGADTAETAKRLNAAQTTLALIAEKMQQRKSQSDSRYKLALTKSQCLDRLIAALAPPEVQEPALSSEDRGGGVGGDTHGREALVRFLAALEAVSIEVLPPRLEPVVEPLEMLEPALDPVVVEPVIEPVVWQKSTTGIIIPPGKDLFARVELSSKGDNSNTDSDLDPHQTPQPHWRLTWSWRAISSMSGVPTREVDSAKVKVGFSVCYCNRDGALPQVVPYRYHASSGESVGSVVVTRPGSYTFVWDNSHSWFRKQRLTYSLEATSLSQLSQSASRSDTAMTDPQTGLTMPDKDGAMDCCSGIEALEKTLGILEQSAEDNVSGVDVGQFPALDGACLELEKALSISLRF
uniref:GOLD domain-containing protein n=1 Tax=Octactis speculum TaxID=3111310 RepID=A0A7S2BMT6_9STRA